jgi:putative membrane protein
MNGTSLRIAILASATALLPSAIVGQMDPSQNTNPAYPGNVNPPGGQTNPPGGMQNGTQTPNTMRDTLGAPGVTGQEMADKKFLQEAGMGGLAQVKLGMLAVQKGGPGVKEFGQKMVDDHTMMNKDIASVADSIGIMMPKKIAKEDQAEYDKLNGLSGDAFDKEYILFMVKTHRQDLHDFRTEASVAANQDLATEAVKASMVIRDHLMMLTKLAADKGVTLPPRPPRPAAPPAGE